MIEGNPGFAIEDEFALGGAPMFGSVVTGAYLLL